MRPGPGRPRSFCRRSCRQRAYEARQRSAAQQLDESELVATRTALETVRDQLFVLRCAVDDVQRDLAGVPTTQERAEALTWLLDACRPLVEPNGQPDPRSPDRP